MRCLLKATAVLVCLIATSDSSASADARMDCLLQKSDCRGLVGKRLWVVVPKANPNSVEVTFAQHKWDKTLKLRSGSFLVIGTAKDQFYGHDLVVKLDDGRSGWVGSSALIFSVTSDPVADAKKAAEDCARRGQPKIGMNPEELTASCWGRPLRIVKKTTAAGIEESYIYGPGHIVKLSNGKIVEIIEAR
jgi:hypothetical protein